MVSISVDSKDRDASVSVGKRDKKKKKKTIHQYSAPSVPRRTTWTAATARPVWEEHLFLWWLTEACSDPGSALNLHQDSESPSPSAFWEAFLSVGHDPKLHLTELGPANQSDGRHTGIRFFHVGTSPEEEALRVCVLHCVCLTGQS